MSARCCAGHNRAVRDSIMSAFWKVTSADYRRGSSPIGGRGGTCCIDIVDYREAEWRISRVRKIEERSNLARLRMRLHLEGKRDGYLEIADISCQRDSS